MDIKVLFPLEVRITFVTFVANQEMIRINMCARTIRTRPTLLMAAALGERTIVPSLRDKQQVPDHIMVRHLQLLHGLEDLAQDIEPMRIVLELHPKHHRIVQRECGARERTERYHRSVYYACCLKHFQVFLWR